MVNLQYFLYRYIAVGDVNSAIPISASDFAWAYGVASIAGILGIILCILYFCIHYKKIDN